MNFISVEEAKKKLCPIFVPRAERLSDALCEAGKCMMWRWDNLPYFEGDANEPTPRGYCGLAGFPHREHP